MAQRPSPQIHHAPPLPGPTSKVTPLVRPRVHRAIALVSYTSVGVISVYNVFFADYGEKEHVFSPARRWLDRQKAAFWTLSPAEQAAAGQLKQPSQPDAT